MKKEVLLALVTALVDEAIQDYNTNNPQPKNRQGPRGFPGKDFEYSEHRETIINEISTELLKNKELFKLKFSDLTDDEKSQLKGDKGQDGKSLTVKEFFPSIRNYIDSIKEMLVLKFSDLTVEEKAQLKGEKGQDGNSVSLDDVKPVVTAYLDSARPDLKLKFDDLTSEEKLSLRGEKGPRGQRGRSFNYEEEQGFIVKDLTKIITSMKSELSLTFNKLTETEKTSLKLNFADLTDDEKETLKLKFSHLTDLDKEQLKLKFSDLTDEDKLSIRGPRGFKGQRGSKGDTGERGERGESIIGPIGPRGLPGVSGLSGRDGKDGQDAPTIIDIGIEQTEGEFSLVFYFSDNTSISTDKITLPKLAKMYSTVMPLLSFNTIEKDGVEIGQTNTLNFTGNNVTVTKTGDKINIAIADDFVVESANYLTVERILDEDIAANTLVSASSGTNVVIASPSVEAKSRVLGLLLTGGTTGQSRRVLLFGNLTLTSNFTLNAPLYLIANGQFSETPPLPGVGVTGFITEVAFSNGLNSVFINPKLPLEVVG